MRDVQQIVAVPEVTPLPVDDIDVAIAGPRARGAPSGLALRLVTIVGSLGLLLATATDALAVLGRHLGIALLGSIEIVQVTVVLIASMAMILATAERAHAAVHIVTDRLPPAAAEACRRAAAWSGAFLFLLVVAGSAWVLADLWGGAERTELLGLPLRWLRLLWIIAAVAVAAVFARQALARDGRR